MIAQFDTRQLLPLQAIATKPTLWRVVPHVERQILYAPIISLTLQQMIRRHPADLKDACVATFAHEMHAR